MEIVFESNYKIIIRQHKHVLISRDSSASLSRWYDKITSEIIEQSHQQFRNILEELRQLIQINILSDQDKIITYTMPYYEKILLEEAKSEIGLGPKLVRLLIKWFSQGWIHDDIAFRNIGINEKGEYEFIDLDSARKIEDSDKINYNYGVFANIFSDLDEINRSDVKEKLKIVADQWLYY